MRTYVHDADQPLTSLEFEAGSGGYSGGLEAQHDPSAVDLKTRLFVAQGHRLLNYYLLASGINPMLDEPVGDGNDRLGFTGERHGTAAPIGPDGSPVMSEVVDDLAAHRGARQRRALARSLLLDGYRFGAVHLEDRDPAPGQVLALASGRHLDTAVQRRVLEHVHRGGRLLYLGPPGDPGRLAAAARVRRGRRRAHRRGRRSLRGLGPRRFRPRRGDHRRGALGPDPLRPRAKHLGISPGVTVEAPWPGIIATTTASADGQRALHLLNHAAIAMDVLVTVDASALHDGAPVRAPARSGRVLPLGLDVTGRRIHWASAEISGHDAESVSFGPGLDTDGRTTVLLAPGTAVADDAAYDVAAAAADGRVRVTGGPGPLTLRWG